mmetsp:Transcript_21012/g.50674  ORF Transcript_21012/g.50674 Transcript_21012/m.50674 type:complete len:681 (+) Transcript_21012:41-2083(+)
MIDNAAAEDEENPPSLEDNNDDHNDAANFDNNNNSTAATTVTTAMATTPATIAMASHHDDDDHSEQRANESSPPPSANAIKRNINSYYGHRIGFLQTLSLTLNAGLMIYAHLGLSAVILSSKDPSITQGVTNNIVVDNDGDAVAVNDSMSQQPVDNDNSTAAAMGAPLTNATSPLNDTTAAVLAVAPLGGRCNAQDLRAWIAHGGEDERPLKSNYCSRERECYLNGECIEACFREVHGYSEECSTCFGVIPTCSIANGCMMPCAADSLGEECNQCNVPCIEELRSCTGLPEAMVEDNIEDAAAVAGEEGTFPSTNNETDKENTTTLSPLPNKAITTAGACNDYDLEAITTWYNVYNLTFVDSVNDAWDGDAKLLAVIVVLFSGIWPYLKNIILVIIWYLPATAETQTSMLLWLSRLSKYTLVDVFAVIGVLVGVQLQLNVGGTEAVTRAEPRFGIIAFFLATVWEFLQIELIKAMHERKVLGENRFEKTEDRLIFSRLWIPALILVASLGLYVSGAISEIVYFASADIGSDAGACMKSYNLVTLGNALINDMSMTGNSAQAQTWILYLSYVVLNLAFPVLTHSLQICFLFGRFRSKRLRRLIEWTSAIWCFACIEVLLIGIFAVEYKFPNLIMKIAGDTNASFLDIDSKLGTGFYILIAYSVVAGFLQFSLRVRHDESPG